MIDLKRLEREFSVVSKRLLLRGVDTKLLMKISSLFTEKKALVKLVNELGEKRNTLRLSRESNSEGSILREQKKAVEEKLRKVSAELEESCSYLPNIPEETVPQQDRVVDTTFYEKKGLSSLDSTEIISRLGIVD